MTIHRAPLPPGFFDVLTDHKKELPGPGRYEKNESLTLPLKAGIKFT